MVNRWLNIDQSCLLCGERASPERPLCTPCELELPWLLTQCRCCGLPLPMAGQLCADCLRQPPFFTRVEAPWRFAFPVDALITRFKHHSQWPYGRLLAELLGRHLQHVYAEGLPQAQCLLPVPLSQPRLRQRGFNQAAMLAQWLSQQLNIPWSQAVLQRVRDTPAQQQLGAKARQRNLRHAFALTNPEALTFHHVALVDDVVTTGSTANGLARLLLQHTAVTRVDVYCLARTPKPSDWPQTHGGR